MIDVLTPTITALPARASFCQFGECDTMARVMINERRYCVAHAVELLNAAHQSAVEEVHRVVRG